MNRLEIQFNNIRKFLISDSIKENDVKFLNFYLDKIDFETAFYFPNRFDSFQRVTINKRVGESGRINEVSKLKYPPKPEMITKYGRLNLVNQQILYGTFDSITALSEMRPDVGDLITVSTWRLRTEYALKVFPIFMKTSLDGESHNGEMMRVQIMYRNFLNKNKIDKNIQHQIEIFLYFLADCFTKKVNDNNHFDYFLSAYYADRLMNKFENGDIDAIMYPSMRQSATFSNIAIKPHVFDVNYELAQVEESIVITNPNSFTGIKERGWYLEGTGFSRKSDGKTIDWT